MSGLHVVDLSSNANPPLDDSVSNSSYYLYQSGSTSATQSYLRNKRDPSCCCCCRTKKRGCITSLSVLFLILGMLGFSYWYIILRVPTPDNPNAPAQRPEKPDPPLAPTLVAADISSLTVAWKQPNYHLRPITRYELQFQNISKYTTSLADLHAVRADPTWNVAYSGRNLQALVRPLQANSVYRFRVMAHNELGAGNFSNSSKDFKTLPPTVPSAPGEPVVVMTSLKGFGLEWAPATNHGSTITSYELQLAQVEGDRRWLTKYQGPLRNHTLTDLAPSTRYQTRVRALSNQGDGGWSQAATHHTDSPGAKAPSAPRFHLEPHWNTFVLVWKYPVDNGAEIESYDGIRNDSKKGRVQFVANPTPSVVKGGDLTFAVLDLSPNTTYTLQLRAVNRLGASAWSANVTGKTLPAPVPKKPQAPYLTTITPTSLSLQWSDDPTGLTKKWELQGTDWWTKQGMTPIFNSSERSFTVEHLLPASNYSFQLLARNGAGASLPSPAAVFQTNPAGSCGNVADMKVFFDTKKTMKSSIQGCLIDAFGKDISVAIACINKTVGLSMNCSTCWGIEGQCTLKHCALKCIPPSSAKCKECSQEKCFPGCVECSGVPMWAFPP